MQWLLWPITFLQNEILRGQLTIMPFEVMDLHGIYKCSSKKQVNILQASQPRGNVQMLWPAPNQQH